MVKNFEYTVCQDILIAVFKIKPIFILLAGFGDRAV
jgi:hypothetical protein